MKRLAGIFGMLVLMSACGVGDPDDPMPLPNGRQCSAVLSTTGSFAPDVAHPPPVDSTGCWPYGMWTFTAKIEMNDCNPAPQVLAQYQFRGDYSLNADGDPEQTFVYTTDPAARHIVKVSQGGAGLCEGELSLYSADGKTVMLLKPSLFADNTIGGEGEYAIYSDNQWPLDGMP